MADRRRDVPRPVKQACRVQSTFPRRTMVALTGHTYSPEAVVPERKCCYYGHHGGDLVAGRAIRSAHERIRQRSKEKPVDAPLDLPAVESHVKSRTDRPWGHVDSGLRPNCRSLGPHGAVRLPMGRMESRTRLPRPQCVCVCVCVAPVRPLAIVGISAAHWDSGVGFGRYAGLPVGRARDQETV